MYSIKRNSYFELHPILTPRYTPYFTLNMDLPLTQDDTTSVSDLTEYTKDSITGSLRPTSLPDAVREEEEYTTRKRSI